SARLPAVFGSKGTSNTVLLMERYARADVGAPPGVLGLQAKVHKWSGPNTTLDCSAPGVGFSNAPQFAPAPGTVDNRTPQGFSASGMQVCLGDGSVRSVTPGTSQQAWNWACNPDDANPPPANW